MMISIVVTLVTVAMLLGAVLGIGRAVVWFDRRRAQVDTWVPDTRVLGPVSPARLRSMVYQFMENEDLDAAWFVKRLDEMLWEPKLHGECCRCNTCIGFWPEPCAAASADVVLGSGAIAQGSGAVVMPYINHRGEQRFAGLADYEYLKGLKGRVGARGVAYLPLPLDEEY